jgi:hypothetical protein
VKSVDTNATNAAMNNLLLLAGQYWAGEAEAARTFFDVQRTGQEHIRWLRLQTYKELIPQPESFIMKWIDGLKERYLNIESKEDRDSLYETFEVLTQEFNHYRLFADILEELTGKCDTPSDLLESRSQYPEEKKLIALRARYAEEEGELGRLASQFNEGGGGAIYKEGSKASGSPLMDKISAAFTVVFNDEVGHHKMGARGVASIARTDEDWAKLSEMVPSIARQRMIMRNEQFGFPLSESRIAEIDRGMIEPLRVE